MTKPDWEAFGKAVIGEWPGLYDLEASEVFDLAKQHGLVVEIDGGFDPDRHDDFHGVGLEKGDPFYRFNFDHE